MAQFTRAVINLAPQHKFKGLKDWPEAQLLLLMPRVLWNRTRAYVPHFEAVHLAGRFGADPGDFEWEVIAEPQGFKWWRRTVGGDPAYCAFIVAPDISIDPVEVFGVLDIASNGPWWFDAIDDIVRVEMRGETYARQNHLSEHQGKVYMSLRDDYGPRRLVTAPKDENGVAWRVGAPEEVEKFKGAFVNLVNRARTATLPGEARPKTGELKPDTGTVKPASGGLKPVTGPLKPVTGGLRPVTGPLKPVSGPLPAEPKKPGTGPLPAEPKKPVSGPLPAEPRKPVSGPLPAEPKKPVSGPLPAEPKKPGTGSLRDTLSNLLKPKTDQLRKDE